MKRRNILLILMLAIMALGAPWTAKAQTTYTAGVIGTGTSTCSYPLPGLYGYQFDVYLYDADIIDVGGTIRSIAWYVTSQTINNNYTCNFTVWMKDVDAGTTLSANTTFADYISGATQVYSRSNYTSNDVTTGAWNTFDLSSTFSHTKGKALLVCVKGNSSYSSGGCGKSVQYTSASGKHWYKHQDTGTDPGNSVTGSLDSYRSNIKLNIGGGSYTTCSGSFYDSGGASGQYGNYESYTYTFYPGTTGKVVQMEFSQLATEGATWDCLRIYDGTSTSATQIGSYGCTTSPGTVTASNNDGALTISWTSDFSNTNTSCVSSYDGWAASISCVSLTNYEITAFVQPANAGTVTGTGIYGSGDPCTLTATANPGYSFDYWIKNGTETIYDNPYNFTVTDDADFQAHFSSCVINTFPWTENFNSLSTANSIPKCWDNSDGTTTNVSYKWCYTTTTGNGGCNGTSHDGSNCVRFNSYSNSNGNTNFFKTPVLDLSAKTSASLTFWYKNPTGGDFSVFISTDGGATYTTSLVTGLTGQSSWTQHTEISLDNYVGSGYNNVVIVFKGTSNYGSGNAYIYLDDVSVTASFAPPHTITANSWPSAGGTVPGTTTVTHGGSTTITASANSGYQFVNWTDSDGDVVSTSTNLSLINVTSDATYQANFTSTSAINITNTSWTENFDGYSSVTSSNWGYLNGEWATPIRDTKGPCVTYYGNAATSGYRSLELRTNSNGNSNMVVLPLFNQPLNKLLISFQIGRGDTSSGYTVELGYVTSPSDAATFTALQTIPVPSSAVGSHTQFSYNLATNNNTPNSSAYRLAIRYTTTGMHDSWYLDDFSVSVPTYTVTYHANGGSGTMTDSNSPYTNGSTVTVKSNEFTRPGYAFIGWNTAANGSGTPYAPNNTFTISDDIALYAQWIETYTVEYDANGGTGTMTDPYSPYNSGSSVTVMSNEFTRPGYDFVRWNTAADGSGTYYAPGANFNISANTTLYAQWIQAFTITYSPSSSNPSCDCYISGSTSAHYGDNIEVTLHLASGYELRSITATDGDDNPVTLTDGGSIYTFTMPASNVTVTAEFKHACMAPTDLAVSTTLSSATITWNDSYGSEWQVAHATSSSADPSSNIISPNVTERTYTMGSLDLPSTHYFWVRSYCGASDQSTWVGPIEANIQCTAPGNTLSASATSTGAVLTWTGGTEEEYIVELGTTTTSTTTETEFSENFESGSLSSDWTFTSNNTANDITASGNYHAGVHGDAAHDESSYGFRFSSYSRKTDSETYDQYLVSPVSLSSAGVLTFYFKKSNDVTETLYVGYSITDNSLSSFTWTDNLAPTQSWQSYTLNLTSDTKYIAFHYFGDYQWYVYLDDISITTTSTTTTTTWTPIATDATSPYTITGCDIGTTYKVHVKDQCNHESNEVEFTPACMAPTDLAVSTTLSSATITWNDSQGSEWQVAHATSSSADPSSNIISPNVTERTYTMGNLTLPSTHYFWVRSYCSSSNQSTWVGPVEANIDCTAPSSLVAHPNTNGAVLTWTGGTGEGYTVELGTPTTSTVTQTVFSEDFEGGSLPSSWTFTSNNTVNDIGGTGTNPAGVYSTAAYNGSLYGFRFSSFSSASDYNQYLVSPQVSLNSAGELTFYFKKYNTSTEELYVGYSTSNNSLSSFTWTENLVPTESWQSYTLSLPSNTKYIAFHYFGSFTYYVYLDDISITTSTTTTTTIWTEVATDATSPYTITGLTSGNTYYARVKDKCNYGTSNEVSFTPACGAPVNVAANPGSSSAEITWAGGESSYNVRYKAIIEEDFESGIPSTWTTIDSDEDGNNWLAVSDIPSTYSWYEGKDLSGWPHGGSDAAASASAYNNPGGGYTALTSDQWLISPLVNLGGTLRFYAHSVDGSYLDAFEVLLSTNGNTISNFTTTLRSMQNASNSDWDEVEIDLSSYAGQQGYIAIHHVSEDKYFLVIDDFTVASPWQTASSNVTSPYTLSGLMPNTDYEVQVQSTCGGDWVGTTFTTSPGYVVTAVAEPAGGGTFAFTGDITSSSTANPAVVTPDGDGDVTVTAAANTGYTFMYWKDESDAVVSTSNSYALEDVSTNRTVTAHFVNQKTSTDWTYFVTSQPSSGFSYVGGSSGYTFTISKKEGLAWLISVLNGLNGNDGSVNVSSTVINLTADIDMSDHTWVPIGTAEHPFQGTFNGNGHVIKGITRSDEFPHNGLFGYVDGAASIKDVVVQATLTGNSIATGAIAGTFASSGTISNVEGAGTLTGGALTTAMGGLVGNKTGGTVHSSFAVATLNGGVITTKVGGLVGTNSGNLYNSYSNATYSGASAAKGGLVGANSGTVENCYVVGIVSGVSAFARSNSGTIQNCYTDAVGAGYVGANSDAPAPTGCGTYGTVQSSTKHLNYMYRDNLITKGTNDYVGSNDAIDDGIRVYVDNHIPVWNGLVSALNQWVRGNPRNINGLAPWFRPLTTNINGDLPVLGFPKDNALATLNSDGKYLQYGSKKNGSNGIDALLSAYNGGTAASIFHYGKAKNVVNVPAGNVNVYIAEDAALLQATSSDPGAFNNTTVGVTFDNSDHGQHAFDFWGNRLLYDWHFMSSPLYNPLTGAEHSSYNPSGNANSDVDITAIGGYFPNGLPMTLHDPDWKWDFYSYYEPQYHWINLKRNKKNHYHQDGGALITYNEADQDLGTHSAHLIPGKGYMMAISQNTFMHQSGTLNRGSVPITLTNQENNPDGVYGKGWNLVGNPYQAYLDLETMDRLPVYIYDAEQGNYVPYAKSSSENPVLPSRYIHPHQAFFMHTTSDNSEAFTFLQSWADTITSSASYYRDEHLNYPLVNLFAENSIGQRDLAIIEFHRPEIGGAPKLEAMRNVPFTLAAHYSGTSYGILFATDDLERVPVHFKTDEDAQMTLTWNTYNGVFSKLYLVDNIMGVTYDMLNHNSYNFVAHATDYSSRFYITYECLGIDEDDDSGGPGGGSFVYVSNGNIVIEIDTGSGTSLQLVDMLGRVLYSTVCTDGVHSISTNRLAKGIYVVRLATNKGVKTQKIVVQ